MADIVSLVNNILIRKHFEEEDQFSRHDEIRSAIPPRWHLGHYSVHGAKNISANSFIDSSQSLRSEASMQNDHTQTNDNNTVPHFKSIHWEPKASTGPSQGSYKRDSIPNARPGMVTASEQDANEAQVLYDRHFLQTRKEEEIAKLELKYKQFMKQFKKDFLSKWMEDRERQQLLLSSQSNSQSRSSNDIIVVPTPSKTSNVVSVDDALEDLFRLFDGEDSDSNISNSGKASIWASSTNLNKSDISPAHPKDDGSNGDENLSVLFEHSDFDRSRIPQIRTKSLNSYFEDYISKNQNRHVHITFDKSIFKPRDNNVAFHNDGYESLRSSSHSELAVGESGYKFDIEQFIRELQLGKSQRL